MNVEDYGNYLLSKGLVTNKELPYYIKWVKTFLQFCQENAHDSALNNALDSYLLSMSKKREQWQVNQAKEAVSLYLFFEKDARRKPTEKKDTRSREWADATDMMKQML